MMEQRKETVSFNLITELWYKHCMKRKEKPHHPQFTKCPKKSKFGPSERALSACATCFVSFSPFFVYCTVFLFFTPKKKRTKVISQLLLKQFFGVFSSSEDQNLRTVKCIVYGKLQFSFSAAQFPLSRPCQYLVQSSWHLRKHQRALSL